jgi:hypothetical protein
MYIVLIVKIWIVLDVNRLGDCICVCLTRVAPTELENTSRCVFDGWSHNCGVARLLDCPRAVFQVPSNKSNLSTNTSMHILK